MFIQGWKIWPQGSGWTWATRPRTGWTFSPGCMTTRAPKLRTSWRTPLVCISWSRTWGGHTRWSTSISLGWGPPASYTASREGASQMALWRICNFCGIVDKGLKEFNIQGCWYMLLEIYTTDCFHPPQVIYLTRPTIMFHSDIIKFCYWHDN